MKIVVLAGGISTERDVSLSSGTMIYHALKRTGHRAVLLDVYLGYPGEDMGNIFETEREWAQETAGIGENNPDLEEIKALRSNPGEGFFGPNVIRICQSADIVFMALHGENGEDGRIQAAFDLLGIKYTGTDYVSSALCMDKTLTKEIFLLHQIPAPKGICLRKGIAPEEKVPFPCVVKTCCGGSSVGVYIAFNQEQYEEAVRNAFLYGNDIIVEQYIKGREFAVGVVAGKALPVIEIAPKCGFYDYKNKYQAGSTVETCPADLEEGQARQMQEYAQQAFEALRLKTYARMDFMMTDNGEIFCLEANTLPGMTPLSLMPQEAAAMGCDFDQLCNWIIKISMEK